MSKRAINKAITDSEIETANKENIEKGDNITFGNFVDRWLNNYVRVDLSVKSKDDYLYLLNNGILDEFKNHKLFKMKTFHIVEKLKEWKEQSEHMALAKYVVLKSIFAKAIEWRVISDNPMNGMKPPKVKKKEKKLRFYDGQQLQNLFEILDHVNEKHKIQIKLAALVGLRMGEIGGIRLECINFKNNTILIDRSLHFDTEKKKLTLGPPKNKIPRTVNVPDSFMKEVKSYVKKQKKLRVEMGSAWKPMVDDEGNIINFLFTKEDGYPQHPRSAGAAWVRIIEKYDLPKITFHELRHSYASFMLSKGVNFKILQEQLGHSDISITMNIYSHLTETDKSKASDLFNEIL
ncbi:site-specific integrase [Gracilibacillus sp. S3-1-1]|uniref:Site-specific integrase n=1 Tax=Gracilibacillus pellucidus TaxID=3095368 RepID=A0ACC6M9H7_9BACI|nr:site-specific integrase [Gracilibacillus sp. S3-1-1]MDX8047507.1 site-specific integrase [Gracilibacillus sp. S3-1-1]